MQILLLCLLAPLVDCFIFNNIIKLKAQIDNKINKICYKNYEKINSITTLGESLIYTTVKQRLQQKMFRFYLSESNGTISNIIEVDTVDGSDNIVDDCECSIK